MATQSERDSARARAKAKEANKRNEEFDRNARRRGAQDRMTRSLQDKGKLATLFDTVTTSPSEREAREDKRVSDLKTGRTRAGERLIAERGKKRDAETKARVSRAAQADIDKRSAASGARLEAKMNKDAENARKLKDAKKTQKAVADFTGESGKRARLSDAKRRADANKTITMSPEDFAKVPSLPPAKKKPVTKRMTEAEVRAMKSSPLNAKNKAKSQGGTAPGIMTRDSAAKPKAAAKPAAKADSKSTAKTEKFGVGDKFVIRGNKANVTDTQLKKTGLTQAQYMKQWRASNKRPTAASASKSTTKSTTTKTPKKVGGLRKFLLGDDGKFGGARGAIDFLPGKSRKKKEDKPVKKMGGGMMRSKMASKGGARGGMKKKGYANGGLAMTKVNGKSVPAFAADGKGANDLAPTKRNMGGMMKSKMASKGGAMKKKGYAMGGAVMKKKGYAKGGAVRSKMASKGGASRKPRGVGVATRGYGKAMR